MRKEHYKMAHTWPSRPSLVFRPLVLSFRLPLPRSRTAGSCHYSQLSFQYFHLPSEVMAVPGSHTAKPQNWNLCLTSKPELFPESRVTANEAQWGLAHHLLTTPLVPPARFQPGFHP